MATTRLLANGRDPATMTRDDYPSSLFYPTSFGHDPALWPVLIEKLRGFGRPVTVWSAGTFLGCEIYTLAMHILDAGLSNVRIKASEGPRLEQITIAQDGLYLTEEVGIDLKSGRLPQETFDRYFRRVNDEFVEVVDEVRALVEFVGPAYVPERVEPADVIMLRNIWVHITPAERLTLARKLVKALPADGLVVFRHCWLEEVAEVMPRRGHKLLYGRPDRPIPRRRTAWREKEIHPATEAARAGP